MGLGQYLWGDSNKKKKNLFMVDSNTADGSFPANTVLPPPKTPHESMEFLARSWSLSASEISKALMVKTNAVDADGSSLGPLESCAPSNCVLPDSLSFASQLPHHPCCPVKSKPVGEKSKCRWFCPWETSKHTVSRKEKERAERAYVHATLSVAGVAAAVAAVSASGVIVSKDEETKMSMAMETATQLLASHFLEVAKQAGAGHDKVAFAVRSAVGVRTAGDLLTVTAAAATALRAAAALRHRVQRNLPWKMSAVFPNERFHSNGPDMFCIEGVLLKRTRKGQLHWKHLSIYINNKSNVVVKLGSKHAGGAFSKKKIHAVYGVVDDIAAWPRRGREGQGRGYFGLTTEKGVVEFECEDLTEKRKWVDGVRNLLDQARRNYCVRLEQSQQMVKLK